LKLTWPQATNGNLLSVKIGGTAVYNTSTGGGSLNTSSLLGTTAQRTVAVGSSATLTFPFQNNANTTASNYDGTATFNPGGTVDLFP
jgi:xanthine dehydrogenase iron-sulfur cluster and FAD-binding subunit A